jgi:hypothetical protein
MPHRGEVRAWGSWHVSTAAVRGVLYKSHRGTLETGNVSWVVGEILGRCFADLIVAYFVFAGGGRGLPPAKTKSETLFIIVFEMATCPTVVLN